MSAPFIILEGPDCVGKTTLGKFLAQEFDGCYIHLTAKGRLVDAMAEYQSNALDNVETNLYRLNRAVIMDRHWPSEFVYGKIYRPTNPSGFNHEPLKERIKNLDGIYIMCDRIDILSAHEKNKNPDHPYDGESFMRVVQEYRDLTDWMSREKMPMLRYSIAMWGHQMYDFASLIKTKYHELLTNRLNS